MLFVLLAARVASADEDPITNCDEAPASLDIEFQAVYGSGCDELLYAPTQCVHPFEHGPNVTCHVQLDKRRLSATCVDPSGRTVIDLHFTVTRCKMVNSSGNDEVWLAPGDGKYAPFVWLYSSGRSVEIGTCDRVAAAIDVPKYGHVGQQSIPHWSPTGTSPLSCPVPKGAAAVAPAPASSPTPTVSVAVGRAFVRAAASLTPVTPAQAKKKKACLRGDIGSSCGLPPKQEVRLDTDEDKRRQCHAAQKQCQHNCWSRENICLTKCDHIRPKESEMHGTSWGEMLREAKKSFAYDNCVTGCSENACYDGCPACAFRGGGGGQPTGRVPAQ